MESLNAATVMSPELHTLKTKYEEKIRHYEEMTVLIHTRTTTLSKAKEDMRKRIDDKNEV